jgi:non-specific serine/threonine protein kinase
MRPSLYTWRRCERIVWPHETFTVKNSVAQSRSTAVQRPSLSPTELRARRRALGLTQAFLAAELDVSANTVARWERGELQIGRPRRVLRRLERLERGSAHHRQAPPRRSTATRAENRLSAERPEPTWRPRTPEQRHNLPSELSSFVGRQIELNRVQRQLRTTRLLTLTGTGGVGKTRLALRLAAQVEPDYSDGVWFVELGPLSDPQQVARSVAGVLGVHERPDQALLQTLVDVTSSRQLLLVLDNCEHLLSACAELAIALLRRCADVRILATSREPLALDGELTWPVPPLVIPEERANLPLEQFGEIEAVRLFIDRARATLPTFELSELNAPAVLDVCRRLDGIPLAIELGAAHVAGLGMHQLAERLDHRLKILTRGRRWAPSRQRTLRALLDWSYDLLNPAEQKLFMRLSVFAGGWSLQVAEAVCAWECLEPDDIVDLLARLVDKSLVVAESQGDGTQRYRLLETLREYGRVLLDASGDGEITRRRHALFFADAPDRWWGAVWWGRDTLARIAQIDRERDNFRTALRWLIDHGEAARAQGLGAALGHFFTFNGVAEGRAWLDEVLSMPDGGEDVGQRAFALIEAGWLAISHGDLGAAREYLHDGLAHARLLGDPAALAVALHWQAELEYRQTEYAASRNYAVEALVFARLAGLRFMEGHNLRLMAQCAAGLGNYEHARVLAEESLPALCEGGNLSGVANSLVILGRIHFMAGDLVAARAVLERALASPIIASAIRLNALVHASWVSLAQGDLQRARMWGVQALVIARDTLGGGWLALPLEAVAYVAAAADQPELALRLAGTAAALREANISPAASEDIAWQQQCLLPARRALGEEASSAAFSDGQSLNAEEATALAFSINGAESIHPTSAHVGHTDGLTQREAEVLDQLAQGKANREIAEALVIANSTVERHVANILNKLQVRSRTAAVAFWLQREI